MRRTFNSSIFFTFFVLLISSCSKKDITDIHERMGIVNLSFEFNDQLKSGKISNEESSPSKIYVSIRNNENILIYNLEPLTLLKFGDEYITEHIELYEGDYDIEDFFVTNELDSVLYVCPKKDSELEYMVDNPLPITFQISKEDTANVEVEVIPAYLAEALKYGYTNFTFTVVDPLEKGLMIYFPFNGDINEESVNSAPFDNKGGTLTSDRLNNQSNACYFNGTGQSINLNNNQPIIKTNQFTISAWVKMDGPGGGIDYSRNTIFQQRDDNADIGITSSAIVFTAEDKDGFIEFLVRSSINNNSESVKIEYPAPEYNEWHHYVATLDTENKMNLFLDGYLVGSADFNQNGDFTTSIDHVDIGIHTFDGNQLKGALNGSIDDFRIYDRALAHQEINLLCKTQ